MPIWILLIINFAGGEPSQIYMQDKLVCEEAAAKINLVLTFTASATCVFAGEENYP